MQGLRLPGLIRGKPVKMRIGARNLASICANWADFLQIQSMSICHSAMAVGRTFDHPLGCGHLGQRKIGPIGQVRFRVCRH